MSQFHDAGVATRPGRESLAQLGEQAVTHFLVRDPPLHQPAGVQITPARQGDQVLRERPELLRLGLRSDDAVVPEEGGRHVVQRRLLVARRAGELPPFGAVPHYSSPPAATWAMGGTPGSSTRTSPVPVSS